VIRLERRIEVDRPATEVFERLTRIEDIPRWQPAVVEAAVTSPGELAIGSTLRIVVDTPGRPTEAIGRLVDFDPPERIALEVAAGSTTVRADVTVLPIDSSSSAVEFRTEVALGGMLRFVEGMARARIEAEAPEAAAAIKRWLEAD
jgi:uncharacterized protein YndB with AHSA1/START domain